MTPESWAQVKEVVALALERPVAERASFVEWACEDPMLRAEINSLLAASDGADSLPDVRDAIAAAAARLLGLSGTSITGDRDAALIEVLETALGQQYEIIRPLGRGGMGAVFLARERALERFVAIKILRADLASAPDSRERFRREARVVAQLSHPGILPLHTFGEVRGVWYFVMGYVRGVSLAERLRAEGRLSAGEAHRILTEVSDAVECAHRHGVVHRDIKPANILLDEETGRAMLADFGISKVKGGDDSLTATGVGIGTPLFMSPEQSIGSPTVDERSDIYSIGAVGYTMIAGHEPFAGVPADQLTWRRLSQDPPSLEKIAPASAGIADIVMRCLARDPAARWPDARSLRNALVRAGGDGMTSLPEALRDLPGFGPYTLLWAAFWIALAMRSSRGPGDRALLVLIAFLVPLGFLLHIWNVGRHEAGTRELATIAFWPPQWWGMWWPNALRRPTDLWRRLPWQARAVRIALSAFILALPAVILFRENIERVAKHWVVAPISDSFLSLEMTLVLAAAIVTALALSWTWRLGLGRPEAVRVLFGATTPSPGWNIPSVARLLRPVTRSAVRPPEHDSPSDHRRAIGELGKMLAASPETNQLLSEVTGSLARALEECQLQIASLSRVASATELDRLTTQLVAFEQESGTPNPEQRRLTDLVRQQLEVMRQMRLRCELVAQHRAKLLGLMRGLWTRLEELHAEGGNSLDADRSLRERLMALRDEIELLASASG